MYQARVLFEQTSRNTYERKQLADACPARIALDPGDVCRAYATVNGELRGAGWTGVIPIQSITPQEQISGSFTVSDLALTQCVNAS